MTTQTWLWAAPAKHSTRQIEGVLGRLELLYRLGVDRHLLDVPEATLRRYARRLASRRPFAGARIVEPARTLEVACFLLVTTDQLLLMVRRRVAEQRAHRSKSRAERIRDRLIEGVRPVRTLLRALVKLPWTSVEGHPALAALATLKVSYEADERTLSRTVSVSLGRVWRAVIGGEDRERAFAAFEVAPLLALRRALRNGTVWIEHSLTFRSRERLFIPVMQWGGTPAGALPAARLVDPVRGVPRTLARARRRRCSGGRRSRGRQSPGH